jgi:hypothetical protein
MAKDRNRGGVPGHDRLGALGWLLAVAALSGALVGNAQCIPPTLQVSIGAGGDPTYPVAVTFNLVAQSTGCSTAPDSMQIQYSQDGSTWSDGWGGDVGSLVAGGDVPNTYQKIESVDCTDAANSFTYWRMTGTWNGQSYTTASVQPNYNPQCPSIPPPSTGGATGTNAYSAFGNSGETAGQLQEDINNLLCVICGCLFFVAWALGKEARQ